MKGIKFMAVGLLIAASMAISGCSKGEKTATGAALGVATGAVIGAATGGAGAAVLGGALGGVTGGVIGHAMGDDKK